MSSTRAADAVRRHAARAAAHHAPAHPDLATVVRAQPLAIELHHGGVSFDDEELLVTQAVREYDLRHGLKKGDVVKVTPLRSGEVLVEHVIAQKATFQGLDNAGAASTSADPVWSGSGTDPQGGTVNVTVTANHHIVAKVAMRDDAGAIVGWVPIYGSLP